MTAEQRLAAARRRRRQKEIHTRRVVAAVLAMIVLPAMVLLLVMTTGERESKAEIVAAEPETSSASPLTSHIERHGESVVIAAEHLPSEERREEVTTPASSAAYFEITAEEREIVERVVMAEAGGEPYAGQVAVAQCIVNACIIDDLRPDAAVIEYGYTSRRPEPSQSVKDAVSYVFDEGGKVTDAPILFFYAPKRVTSDWHESQTFEIEINNHRFFSTKGAKP